MEQHTMENSGFLVKPIFYKTLQSTAVSSGLKEQKETPIEDEDSSIRNIDKSDQETLDKLVYEEKAYYGHLCRLLLDGGAYALRHVFNLIHPAIDLADRLSKPDTLKVLRRMRLQSVISGKQWDIMYPKYRRCISSANYDTPLLMLLLQSICHISPPYPNGWRGLPLPDDISISADIARISCFRKLLASKQSINAADYEAYWSQIGEILVRLGGTTIKVKLDRLARDRTQSQIQNTWIIKLQVRFYLHLLVLVAEPELRKSIIGITS